MQAVLFQILVDGWLERLHYKSYVSTILCAAEQYVLFLINSAVCLDLIK
jgi:hypothetical protein